MIDRFKEAEGRQNRILVLRDLSNFQGNLSLIERVADECQIVEWKNGETIIKEGDEGREVFFILSGEIQISVLGKTKSILRRAPVHVGEMSALQPSHPRSATIKAKSDVVVAGILTGSQFLALIEEFPKFDSLVKNDIYCRAKGWMKPKTEKSSQNQFTYKKMAVVALVSTIVFMGLFLNFLTTSLAIAATAAGFMTLAFLVFAWINRAAILWALFAGSAGTTISSLVPGFRFSFKVTWDWIQLDGGYGGDPSIVGTIALVSITALTLYAALKASTKNS